MGLFSKKNDKTFLLEPQRISYGASYYSYDDVQHIRFVQGKTDIRLNFLKVDEIKGAYLELTMRSGVVIEIFEQMHLIGFGQDKIETLKNIFDAFVFLSRRTFKSRLSYYTEQVNKRGYFAYSGGKFYPEGKIVMPKGEVVVISDYAIYKSGDFIKIKPKSSGDLWQS